MIQEWFVSQSRLTGVVSITYLPPHLLEVINGVLVGIYCGILFVFLRYIWLAIRRLGWRETRRQRAAAIGVCVLITGDLVIRLVIWALRHMENNGGSAAGFAGVVTVVSTIGVAICIFGGICLLRHFSERRWKHWPWVLVTSGSLALGFGMAARGPWSHVLLSIAALEVLALLYVVRPKRRSRKRHT